MDHDFTDHNILQFDDADARIIAHHFQCSSMHDTLVDFAHSPHCNNNDKNRNYHCQYGFATHEFTNTFLPPFHCDTS